MKISPSTDTTKGVPMEPTPEMLRAGAFFQPSMERCYTDAEVRNIYHDMVEAAPRIDYAAGTEYQLAQRVLRDYAVDGPHGEAVVLARAYMAMVEAANGQ